MTRLALFILLTAACYGDTPTTWANLSCNEPGDYQATACGDTLTAPCQWSGILGRGGLMVWFPCGEMPRLERMGE